MEPAPSANRAANIRLDYVYRDASNNKRWSHVVISNPEARDPRSARRALLEATMRWHLFEDTIHFRPEAIGLATCYFTDIGYAESPDDFELHEIDSVEATDDPATDPRSLEQLMADMRRV